MCISNDRIVEVLWGKAQKEFRSSKHDILHTVYASTPYRRMGRDFAGIKFEITVVSTYWSSRVERVVYTIDDIGH